MNPRTYFRLALLVPLVFPFGVLAISVLPNLMSLMAVALGFGGAGYAVLSLILWRVLGKYHHSRQYIRISLVAPLLFIPIQAFTWILWSLINQPDDFTPANLLGPPVIITLYIILFGYFFALITCLAFKTLKAAGAFTEE